MKFTEETHENKGSTDSTTDQELRIPVEEGASLTKSSAVLPAGSTAVCTDENENMGHA